MSYERFVDDFIKNKSGNSDEYRASRLDILLFFYSNPHSGSPHSYLFILYYNVILVNVLKKIL